VANDTDSVKLNFANVPDQKSFAPAPPGVYTLRVMDYKLSAVKSGKNEGATMIQWTHEIVDEEDEDSKVNGKKVFDNHILTENAYFRMKAFLKALGFDVDDSDSADDVDFAPSSVIGDTFVARLAIEPENKDPKTGKTYAAKNKIAKFIVPGDEDDD
jgi:hypothetical protein